MKPTRITAGLSIVAMLIIGGWLAGRASVRAVPIRFETTGPIAQGSDGALMITDDSNTYPLVSAVDLSPFIGSSPSVGGGLDEGTLYVTSLTLGSIRMTVVEDGTPVADVTGTVEIDGDVYVTTVEGITFTLTGSDDLPQAVGQSAAIEGELTGSFISVTSITL